LDASDPDAGAPEHDPDDGVQAAVRFCIGETISVVDQFSNGIGLSSLILQFADNA
jgi:hypothetical protein